MSDVSVALAMLRTFNDSATYKGIITTIRVSAKLEELTLDEIESTMVIEARDIDVESKVESGFGASEHPPCPHCGKTNHPPERCWIKHAQKRPKTKTVKFPKKKGYKKDSDKSEGAGAAMHQVYSVMARAGPEEWIIDSGASAHMTGIKSLLKDYKEDAMTTVTLANGDILPAKGVGNISFKTEHGYVTFTGVLLVPGLDRNHILVPELTSKSLAIRMLKGKCLSSTPCFQIDCCHSSLLLPSALDVYLESLIDDHSVVLIKLGRFVKSNMDIKGPMDMMSIGKHLYFLILVDDDSGLTVAYPMQKKSDTLKFYTGFAEKAWNQTGKRISYLRCDNAKEFLSSAFNQYLSTQGMVLQDIPDCTPELNGNAERNIRTVMNMMRSMLKGAGMPRNLWAEAITAACYIKNPFTSSSKSTPHEL
jgi:hypothetical protein